MDRSTGLDAHASSCTVATMGPSGRGVHSQVVNTNAGAPTPCVELRRPARPQSPDRGLRQRRSLPQQAPERQLKVPFRQPVPVQFRDQRPYLLGSPGEGRQHPALKSLLHPSHPGASQRDRSRTHGQVPWLPLAVAVAWWRIHRRSALRLLPRPKSSVTSSSNTLWISSWTRSLTNPCRPSHVGAVDSGPGPAISYLLGHRAKAYTLLVADSVRVQNRIKSLFRSRGVAVAGKGVLSAT